MKPLITDVNKIIRKIFGRKNPILAEIIINWDKMVGIKFSRKSRPLKIANSYERGQKINILYIEVENSSLSMELSYQQDIILERIAVYLGHKGIHKIRIIVSG
jgi:hypothetical protein